MIEVLRSTQRALTEAVEEALRGSAFTGGTLYVTRENFSFLPEEVPYSVGPVADFSRTDYTFKDGKLIKARHPDLIRKVLSQIIFKDMSY